MTANDTQSHSKVILLEDEWVTRVVCCLVRTRNIPRSRQGMRSRFTPPRKLQYSNATRQLATKQQKKTSVCSFELVILPNSIISNKKTKKQIR